MIPSDTAQTRMVIVASICEECNALKIGREDYKREFVKRAVDRLKMSEDDAGQTFDSVLALFPELSSDA